MKLLTVAAFCSIAVLTCADKVKDASSLNKENGAVNHAEHARSLLAPDTLNQGYALARGYGLESPSGRFHLDMQHDGNLVLYRRDDNKPIWHSNTWYSFWGSPGGENAILQNDGNFVVYSYEGSALWASNTNGLGENYLRVQDDGNMVIYTKGSNAVQWASGTDWALPKKAKNLRAASLDATHVANSSAMTMQGAVPHTLVKIAHFDKDAVSANGVGVGVGAPDQASNITLNGTN
jgi:hypothetical protein